MQVRGDLGLAVVIELSIRGIEFVNMESVAQAINERTALLFEAFAAVPTAKGVGGERYRGGEREGWESAGECLMGPVAGEYQVTADPDTAHGDVELAGAERIALRVETGKGGSQERDRWLGEVEGGDGAVRPPIGDHEEDTTEIHEAGAEKGERAGTEQRHQENQLAGDHDRFAEIDQVVPPAIAAERVAQGRDIARRHGGGGGVQVARRKGE